jgi:hypothetical protein
MHLKRQNRGMYESGLHGMTHLKNVMFNRRSKNESFLFEAGVFFVNYFV